VGIEYLKKKKLVEHPKPSQPWWSCSPDPAAWLLRMSQYPCGAIFVIGWPRALSKVYGLICKLAEKKIN
jgi:hypothetical protein